MIGMIKVLFDVFKEHWLESLCASVGISLVTFLWLKFWFKKEKPNITLER